MNVQPQLVLDIGGVLATNLTPAFWVQLAEHADVPYDVLRGHYKKHLRESLWAGTITEAAFWSELCTHFPAIDETVARELLQNNLRPLPALNHLAEWSQIADLHILSNHRAEWLAPLLGIMRPYLTSITVSSVVGSAKPHPDIYQAVAAHLPPRQPVLFVDDTEKNFPEAAILGWQTLLADETGVWIERVVPLLQGDRRESR